MTDFMDDEIWIDATYPKNQELKSCLEERAKTQKIMSNFSLKNCDLSNINLVNTSKKEGYKFHSCNLYKSNFEKSHCYKVDFTASNLMKSNFSNANLNGANLSDCNLLGTNFKNAKLENIIWGKELLQEKNAKKCKDTSLKIELYQEAEEIYRYLRKITEEDGLVDTAGFFFQKEMQMRRKKMKKYSMQRLISKIVDLSCGYGEKPIRIISLSIFIIFFFSFLFFLTGLLYEGHVLRYLENKSFLYNIDIYLNSLYFSVVTFTTLGYGDILPLGFSRLFAALEALIGGFILAIFVVVFVKKMTR